mmetsp:Transcript_58247/g.187107  ORF Transcript_58247/g.187107 Transcript_58247/m.187107 type:complete len:152 (+) Transcript_58247:72-527(+)
MGGVSSCCASNDVSKPGTEIAGVDHLAEVPTDWEHGATEAAMDPAVFEGTAKKEEGSEVPRVIELVVQKSGPDDKLGMDVKHVRERLIIVQVFPGGAIDRANQISRSRDPPEETLEVGDIIVQVNDVANIDTAMVAECQQQSQLRIRALRR